MNFCTARQTHINVLKPSCLDKQFEKIPLMRIDRLNSYENVCLQSGYMNKLVLIYYKVLNATYIEILPATV